MFNSHTTEPRKAQPLNKASFPNPTLCTPSPKPRAEKAIRRALRYSADAMKVAEEMLGSNPGVLESLGGLGFRV